MSASNTTEMKAERHCSVLRDYRRSIKLFSRFFAGALLLLGSGAQAQPPWVVDWYHDQALWHNAFMPSRIKINPNSGRTVFYGYDYDGLWWDEGCQSGWQQQAFDTDGSFMGACCYGSCIETWGITQRYHGTLFPAGGGALSLFDNTSTAPYWSVTLLGVYYPSFPGEPVALGCGGTTYQNIGSGQHAFLADGGNVFVGGLEDNCENRLWKTTYPNPQSTGTWCACLPHWLTTLDLYADTLLAVGFPTVTKVDTTNGNITGTFALYSGPTVTNGWTCTSADTLYWTSQFGTSDLHVGKYLINSGPLWEVTLPYSGNPVELHDDGMGRLWTAVGNTIIWLDQSDGSYNTYPFALSVDAMDMHNGSVAITGDAGGGTSYIMRAHILP